jgi:hypothetical protein
LEGEYNRALGNLKDAGVLPNPEDEEAPGDWRAAWNKKYFDNNLGLKDPADRPTLRRAK